ncbi:MAG: folate-binding protein [Alphaproteobacteria bacterium]|nr:folate-binding protein [Alphaproteobacteria bacterium]
MAREPKPPRNRIPLASRLGARELLEVKGADRLEFLQGLLSNDLRLISEHQPAIFAALLNAQGRFLCDLFVVQPRAAPESWLLDCSSLRAEFLRTTLLRYRLRAKVEIEPRPDLGVMISLGDFTGESVARFVDPRSEQLGERIIASLPQLPDIDSETLLLYERRRITQAIPDGILDMVPEKSLLMENNYDLFNGIAWNKGCYIGQEITARMKYRGLVKHQLRCFESPSEFPPAGSPLMVAGEEIGIMTQSRISHSSKWLGLALSRLV